MEALKKSIISMIEGTNNMFVLININQILKKVLKEDERS